MKRIVLVYGLCAAWPAWCAGEVVTSEGGPSTTECPAAVAVTQQVRDVAAPWHTADLDEDGLHRLTGAAIFSGPPELRRELRPSDVIGESGAAGQTFRYEFSPAQRSGIYLVCRYDATTVVAFRRIVPDPQSCTFEYKSGPGGLAPIVVHCQ